MAKVGILTFHRAQNYGAALQAYALRKTIDKLGHEAEIIDYGIIGETKRFNLELRGLNPFIAGMIYNFLSLFNADIRRYRFRKFRKEMMGVSSERYKDRFELDTGKQEYDLYITGSDQVWNPQLTGGDLTYLLDFIDQAKKKVSYAASFGTRIINNSLKDKYKTCLYQFKALSVREQSGQNIIMELCGKESTVVLDPTLLLNPEEWDEIAGPSKIHKPYILCFTIMSEPTGFVKFYKHLQKITGFEIVRIVNPLFRLERGVKTIATAGPREFLGLVRDAAFVLTNSFHMTTFSIIYQRPFFTFLYNNDRDIRLKEITSKLGLSERLVSAESDLLGTESLNINYSEVFANLNFEKKKSIDYLEKALKV